MHDKSEIWQEALKLHHKGLIAAQQGQYETCAKHIRQALQMEPNIAVFHNNLGNALVRLNEIAQATHHFQTALQLNPDYAEACNNLGRLCHKQKEWQMAQDYYTKAIQLNDHYLEAHLNLGLLFIEQNNIEAAKQQFQHLLTLYPNTPQAHEQLAQIAIHTQDWKEAQNHYQQLLQITPNSSDAWNNLAALLNKTQQVQQAITHAQKALALDPYHASARFNLASFYLQSNQFKEAIWHYSLYLRSMPQDSEAYYNLGVTRMLSGHLPEAIATFQKTLDLLQNEDNTQNRGQATGKATWNEILERRNTHADFQIILTIDTLSNLGALYLRQNDSNLAISAYQHILKLDSQHPIANYMLATLTQQKTPDAAPRAYIKHLFDHYASHFDLHLTQTLHYQVPEQLYALSVPHLKKVPLAILDLGCGTGLSGQAFKSIARYLVGVDISSGMLAEAKKKELYDELIEEDLIHFLTHSNQSYDLMLCVDTLVYFGKLDSLFELVSTRLKSDAYWAFSVELCKTGDDYQLQSTGRYQHRFESISLLAHQYHFRLVNFSTSLGRQQLEQPIPIGLFLLQKV